MLNSMNGKPARGSTRDMTTLKLTRSSKKLKLIRILRGRILASSTPHLHFGIRGLHDLSRFSR